jgi:trehalose synthase
VTDVDGCARSCLFLLQHPNRAKQMGERAKEHVRKNFLSTRHLMDYLKMFNDLAGRSEESAAATTQSGD